ncbi:hypothetical protein K7432_001692 [Basidiobolus ranarum]|uniref:Ion transport domain-containing protein n=1 Tax=Basidiobolus ranarum TaxID=34480 RepID=A0ABR2X2W4_9FUNG
MIESPSKDKLETPIEGISRSERVHQLVFSKFYTALYIIMAILSLISVIISLLQQCPGTFYIVLEIIVNTVMIVEVTIRLVVYGKKFWKSWMNILDVVIVLLCIITVVFLFMDCSTIRGRGELASTLFLVFRNTTQFFRLFIMIRKNKQHLTGRKRNTIEFKGVVSEIEEGNLDTVHSGFSPGYILEEESDDEPSAPTSRTSTHRSLAGLKEITVIPAALKK